MAPGSCREGFGEFWLPGATQAAADLSCSSNKFLRPWQCPFTEVPGKVCRGLSGAWELQGRVPWGVLRRHSGRGRPFLQLQQVPEAVAASFYGRCRKGLPLPEWRLKAPQGRVPWGVPRAQANGRPFLNVHKKTLPRPWQGLVMRRAGKAAVCQWRLGAPQGRVPWAARRRHSGRGRPFLQLPTSP